MITSTELTGFDARFDDLATLWEAHQRLRRSEAGVAELARSREALDEARNRMQALLIAA